LIGGDVFVKRAIYSTIDIAKSRGGAFDLNQLLGNIAIAQKFESVTDNGHIVTALVDAEGDSVFASEVAIAISAAHDLGIDRRYQSDWFGGFSSLLDEASATAGDVSFYFSPDGSGSISRNIAVGNFTLADSVNSAELTTIETFDGAQLIDLRTGKLA